MSNYRCNKVMTEDGYFSFSSCLERMVELVMPLRLRQYCISSRLIAYWEKFETCATFLIVVIFVVAQPGDQCRSKLPLHFTQCTHLNYVRFVS